jgi:UPF0755 protein
MRSIAANAITLLILLGLAVAGLVTVGQHRIAGPGPLTVETRFVVPRGASLDRVAQALETEGVIGSAALFRIAARTSEDGRDIRFGEYAVPPGASIRDVLDLLRSGRVVQYPVTVPEGMTSWEIVELLKGVEVLEGDIATVPPEGTLAPDTYSVSRGDTRAALIARMTALQARRLEEAWAQRAPDIAVRTPQEALILASLIEKETAVPEERPLIGGVFNNRLKRNMRLQTDPTIIYGITRGQGPLDRPIRRSDIDRPTPWNTYTIDGLPPTPIANPGREALLAATRPAETRALYFVADGTGGHAFAETLAEHNRNVAAWRAIERQRANR